MKKFALVLLCGIAAAGALAILPLSAGELDAYVYTYDGRPGLFRRGKVIPIGFDMPVKDADVYRAESDNSIDFIFFRAVGLRFMGPGDFVVKRCTSLTGLEMRVSGGSMLLHVDSPDASVDIALEMPGVIVRARQDALAFIRVVPEGEDGKRATTEVLVKKGRLEVTTQVSGSTVHVLEHHRIKVEPDTFIPAAQGATIEELKPAEAARGVYIPKNENGEDENF